MNADDSPIQTQLCRFYHTQCEQSGFLISKYRRDFGE